MAGLGTGIHPARGSLITTPSPRPTKQEIENAAGRTIDDVVARDLKVLFCGINPGLYSGATGLHFARPGNRFWKTLHQAGFTPRLLDPTEQSELLEYGLGITNIASRATATAAELTPDELREGGETLRRKVRDLRPKVLGVLGVAAFRVAFGDPKANVGRRSEMIGDTTLWVLPNPSGLNAHYQIPRLVELFSELRRALKP